MICQELLTAGTTAAFIYFLLMRFYASAFVTGALIWMLLGRLHTEAEVDGNVGDSYTGPLSNVTLTPCLPTTPASLPVARPFTAARPTSCSVKALFRNDRYHYESRDRIGPPPAKRGIQQHAAQQNG